MRDAIPFIVLTPGEPAGVGPDLVLSIARDAWPTGLLAVADPGLLARRARLLGLDVKIVPLQLNGSHPPHRPGILNVLPVPLRAVEKPGVLDTANGTYVLETLDVAVQACLDGKARALVTGPVHKGVINDAGVSFTGHTERLADLSGTPQVVMMLTSPGLRVALVTTHLPLKDVPEAITPRRLESVLQVLYGDLECRFGLVRPRVLVCGLNPHAGEGGHLGREEIEVIAPVVERLRLRGMNVEGPVPADTAFTPASLRGTDAVLAMYHDQGLPVIKAMGFGETVNITLGLPFVRTSVDHGTALDLAGTGRADPGSLRHALRQAISLSSGR